MNTTPIESFVGLEVHIQLLTKTKVFCSCPTSFGAIPNTNICPVCLGYPGVLPVVNKDAVFMAYKVSHTLKCEMAKTGIFERKSYFYPDMTKNYQISQFEKPFGKNGSFEFELNGEIKSVRIHDVHLEEDAGKMIHDGGKSFLDYNRAGSSLLEIVTEPDLKNGEEAEAFLLAFRRMVRYLEVCDGNMEEGSMRCDANVSVNFQGNGLGRKVEIKNVNSSRFVRLALNYEIQRQSRMIAAGQIVTLETRLYDDAKSMTESMRSKEEALDYRYFPEPDLPPFTPDEQFLKAVEASMVELPITRKKRYRETYGFTEDQADFLTDEKKRADYFDQVILAGCDAQTAMNWLKGDVTKLLNRDNKNLENSPLPVVRFISLLKLMADGTIHGKIGKQVLEAVFDEDKDPETIIMEKNLQQMGGGEELEKIIEKVLNDNASIVAQIREGNVKPKGFLVGQIMKATAGSADPAAVQAILLQKLGV